MLKDGTKSVWDEICQNFHVGRNLFGTKSVTHVLTQYLPCKYCINIFSLAIITGSFSLYPPYSKKGGHSETLLNTCIAHSTSADLLLSNNASDWLSGDFDNKNQ